MFITLTLKQGDLAFVGKMQICLSRGGGGGNPSKGNIVLLGFFGKISVLSTSQFIHSTLIITACNGNMTI